MNKKSVLIMVTLLVSATFMASMAYSRASVTNASTLSIMNTSTSLLSLIPATENDGYGTGASFSKGHKDQTASVKDGNLLIDVNKGLGDVAAGSFGVQKGSIYEFDHLFDVKNNSNEDLQIELLVPASLAPYVDFGLWTLAVNQASGEREPMSSYSAFLKKTFTADATGLNAVNNGFKTGDKLIKINNIGMRSDSQNYIDSNCKSYYALPAGHSMGISLKVDSTNATTIAALAGSIKVISYAVPGTYKAEFKDEPEFIANNVDSLHTPLIYPKERLQYWREADNQW